MKHLRKVMALVLAAFVALVVATPAWAQEKAYAGSDGDGATITVNNPAKGETYSVFKLFDATVSADKKISYKGTVPPALADFFETDSDGNVKPKAAILVDSNDPSKGTKMTDDLKTALETWAGSATAAATAVSDGTALDFTNLPYGYYVMTTSHEDDTAGKALISVTSTKPNASIFDKNENKVTVDKTVENTSYNIGDTIKYTAKFGTTNWLTPKNSTATDGSDAKQVTKYEISDTLPDFLSGATVTGIFIDEDGKLDTTGDQTALTVQQFDSNKKITIPWVKETVTTQDHKYTSLYKNGVYIIVTYTAKLTSTANINTANTNTVTILPYVDNGTEEKPWEEPFSDDAVVKTYGTALKKVDGKDQTKTLKGAKFQVPGLTVEEVKDDQGVVEPGVYKVVSYDATSTTAGTEMTVNDDGMLYIIGIAEETKLSAIETVPPEGYNLATTPTELPAQLLTETIYETSGTRYYDAKGNLVKVQQSSSTAQTVTKNYTKLEPAAVKVINNEGLELPSTGGMGTTILYTIGGIMLVGGAIALVSKKRVANMEK